MTAARKNKFHPLTPKALAAAKAEIARWTNPDKRGRAGLDSQNFSDAIDALAAAAPAQDLRQTAKQIAAAGIIVFMALNSFKRRGRGPVAAAQKVIYLFYKSILCLVPASDAVCKEQDVARFLLAGKNLENILKIKQHFARQGAKVYFAPQQKTKK